MLRLERHRLGPRVYVLGLRIHEVVLGFAVLGVPFTGALAEIWEDAFRHPADYVIQKTPGVFSLHILLPEVVEIVRSRGQDLAKEIGQLRPDDADDQEDRVGSGGSGLEDLDRIHDEGLLKEREPGSCRELEGLDRAFDEVRSLNHV